MSEKSQGPYSLLNQRVKEMKNSGTPCIDRKYLANYIDLSEMDRKDLEKQCANAMANVILWQNGYRSFSKGEGLFILPERFKDPRYIHQLVNNAIEDRDRRSQIIAGLKEIERNCVSQYSDGSKEQYFDFDEFGNMEIKEELNIDEAIKMLRMVSKAFI